MSYAERPRRDLSAHMPPPPQRSCPRCFRMYLDAARERAMTGHTCPACIERQRALEPTS